MNNTARGKVMVFVRNPKPGAVKTRLERDIAAYTGPEQARALTLALYEAFVLDTVDGLRRATAGNDVALRICFDPPGAEEQVRRWLGADLEYARQHGDDLGARMARAFEEAWQDTDCAVLTGSDVPDYPPELMIQALGVLHSQDGVDAVIAPSLDGGYFLIGFRKRSYRRDFFEGLDWGGESVFETTLEMLQNSGLHVEILPEWNDVDQGCDALALLALHEQDDFTKSRTFALLDEHRALFERFDIDAPVGCAGSSLRRRLAEALQTIHSEIRSH